MKIVFIEDPECQLLLRQRCKLVIQYFNCRLYRNGKLSTLGSADLWVCNGVVLNPYEAFYRAGMRVDVKVDCMTRILSPGFIDIQVNGAFGADFTSCAADLYREQFAYVAQQLLQFGVTAFCPTIISSQPNIYHAVLPMLNSRDGSGADGVARFLGLI